MNLQNISHEVTEPNFLSARTHKSNFDRKCLPVSKKAMLRLILTPTVNSQRMKLPFHPCNEREKRCRKKERNRPTDIYE